ncbi:MAG: hypothetical protein ABI862_04315 [Ilumatobacteraceae bacterium]
MTPDRGQDNSIRLVAQDLATNDPLPIVDAERRSVADRAFQSDPMSEFGMSAFGRRAWLDLG